MLSWFCPGIELIGVGACRPSRTNAGWIICDALSCVSRTSLRSAGVRRRRRGRSRGNPMAPVSVAAEGRGALSPPAPSPSADASAATASTRQTGGTRLGRGLLTDADDRDARRGGTSARVPTTRLRAVLPLVSVIASIPVHQRGLQALGRGRRHDAPIDGLHRSRSRRPPRSALGERSPSHPPRTGTTRVAPTMPAQAVPQRGPTASCSDATRSGVTRRIE